MSSTSLADCKPLLKVVDTHKNVYFTDWSRSQFEDYLKDGPDFIYFSISKQGVRKPYIVSYSEADTEEVMTEWAIQQLPRSQRACVEASRKVWNDYWQ